MKDLVETGAIGMEKIDESVGRILNLKEKAGALNVTRRRRYQGYWNRE